MNLIHYIAGVPTPHLIGDMNLYTEGIFDKSMVDKTTYAIVQSATEYLSWKKIEEDFVTPFTLGSTTDNLYMVKLEHLIDPIFVIYDYGGQTGRFFVCCRRGNGHSTLQIEYMNMTNFSFNRFILKFS